MHHWASPPHSHTHTCARTHILSWVSGCLLQADISDHTLSHNAPFVFTPALLIRCVFFFFCLCVWVNPCARTHTHTLFFPLWRQSSVCCEIQHVCVSPLSSLPVTVCSWTWGSSCPCEVQMSSSSQELGFASVGQFHHPEVVTNIAEIWIRRKVLIWNPGINTRTKIIAALGWGALRSFSCGHCAIGGLAGTLLPPTLIFTTFSPFAQHFTSYLPEQNKQKLFPCMIKRLSCLTQWVETREN